MHKKLFFQLALLVALVMSLPSAALAQWTVYDPSNYYENLQNYYQLYQENQQLIQQYNQWQQQFTQTTHMGGVGWWAQYNVMQTNTPGSGLTDRYGNSSTFSGNQSFNTFMAALSAGDPGYSNPAMGYNTRLLNLPSTTTNNWGNFGAAPVAYNNYLLHYGLAANGLTAAGVANRNVIQRNNTLTQLEQAVYDTNDQTEQSTAQKSAMAAAILARAANDTNNLLAAHLGIESARSTQQANDIAEKLQNQSNMQTSQQQVDQSWTTGGSNLQNGYNTLSNIIKATANLN